MGVRLGPSRADRPLHTNLKRHAGRSCAAHAAALGRGARRTRAAAALGLGTAAAGRHWQATSASIPFKFNRNLQARASPPSIKRAIHSSSTSKLGRRLHRSSHLCEHSLQVQPPSSGVASHPTPSAHPIRPGQARSAAGRGHPCPRAARGKPAAGDSGHDRRRGRGSATVTAAHVTRRRATKTRTRPLSAAAACPFDLRKGALLDPGASERRAWGTGQGHSALAERRTEAPRDRPSPRGPWPPSARPAPPSPPSEHAPASLPSASGKHPPLAGRACPAEPPRFCRPVPQRAGPDPRPTVVDVRDPLGGGSFLLFNTSFIRGAGRLQSCPGPGYDRVGLTLDGLPHAVGAELCSVPRSCAPRHPVRAWPVEGSVRAAFVGLRHCGGGPGRRSTPSRGLPHLRAWPRQALPSSEPLPSSLPSSSRSRVDPGRLQRLRIPRAGGG